MHVLDEVIFDVDMLGSLMKLWVPHQAYRALIVTKQCGGTILLAADVLEKTPQPRNLFGGHTRGDILGFCNSQSYTFLSLTEPIHRSSVDQEDIARG